MKRTPRKNLNRTPLRRSARKIPGMIKKSPVKRLIKMKTYESPLKHFQKRGKRHLVNDDQILIEPAKRQKVSRERDSIIILNDENDFEYSRSMIPRTSKVQNSKNNSSQENITSLVSRKNVCDKKNLPNEIANDSVIILEDDENHPSSANSNQTEDVMVVWSSVPDSPEENNQITHSNSVDSVPFVIDNTPNNSNLAMLKGDYPRAWLTNWLKKEKKNTKNKPKSVLLNSKKYQLDKTKKKTKTQSEQKEEKAAEKKIVKRKGKKKKMGKPPKEKVEEKEIVPGKLREIIVDGPNVAKEYSKGKFFSEEGLKLVIDFFKEKGHTVKAFVPQHVRNRNRQILETLNREGFIVFTPSRKAGTKSITPYEDRYILEYATKCDGIVVSNDQYKDLYEEKPEWRETIENRILPLTFIGDLLMFPEDPLGRHGPKLDTFLRHET